MVEGARLESVYTVTPYRGFESHRLRQIGNCDYPNDQRGGWRGQAVWARGQLIGLECTVGRIQADATSLSTNDVIHDLGSN